MRTEQLTAEIARRIASGMEQLSMEQLQARFAALGYRFDRSCDCKGMARYMSGEYAGHAYPALTLYPVQADNGLSAWNAEARRDSQFQAMQRLRKQLFAVSRGAIVEV